MLAALLLLAITAGDCAPGRWCAEGAGYRPGTIFGLDGTASDDVWAWQLESATHHWDGARWTKAELAPGLRPYDLRPLGRGSALLLTEKALWRWEAGAWARWLDLPRPMTALWASGADDVWVFGQGAIRIRQGKLEEVPFGRGTLMAAAGRSTTDVWAVGEDAGGMVVAHWDGKRLSRELLPYSARFASAHMAPDGAVTIAGDSAVLRRKAGKWERVLDHPNLRLGRGAPLLATAGNRAPISFSSEVKAPPELPDAYLYALWANGAGEVFVGGAGVLARWAGERWSGAERVSTDELLSVCGNSAGEVWAVGMKGDVLRRKEGRWAKVPPAPERNLQAVYSAGPAQTWVGGTGLLARFDGRGWKNHAGRDDYYLALWGSGPDDVWAVGRDVRHWDGKSWGRIELGSTATFRAVVGDGKGTVWILARGPRPEHTDGPSTGLPDDVIEVSPTGATRSLEPKDRPAALAFAAGSLWALGGTNGLQRFDGKRWVKDPKLRMASPHRLLETRAGLLLVGTDNVWWLKGAEWTREQPENGRSMFDAWSSSSEVFVVGRDGLLLRWATP